MNIFEETGSLLLITVKRRESTRTTLLFFEYRNDLDNKLFVKLSDKVNLIIRVPSVIGKATDK